MPCYIRMKRTFLQGLLWLYLLGFGFMALSLEPGYLDFDNLPDTNFSCVGKVIGGYYADLETNCQMFHVCTYGQLEELMDIRFLCLNGTVFDQETRVCERIDEVDCSKSEHFYSLNLELYGNNQPATLEESPETEQPLVIKPTTTTTTTTQAPQPKTTRAPFYTTATTPRATTPTSQVISTHYFPVVNSPDIRFNPEEINISLNPGAPPDIRTKPVTYHHSYSDNNKQVIVTTLSENSDNKKVTVTTPHSSIFDDEKVLPHQEQGFIERPQMQVASSHKSHSGPSYGHGDDDDNKNFNRGTSSDINFGFTFHQTESSEDYQTEDPHEYHFHSDFRAGHDYSGQHHHYNPHSHQFKAGVFSDGYTTTTSKANSNFQQNDPTTIRNYLQSLKPPAPNQHHHYTQHRTENPEKLQLPIPLLPTLPPLTFSTPAPFSLRRHIDTKRYTKDHQAPPRIIISASASVSDASGRRLNYSLGTIGAAEILEEPPSTYDEYKEEDVGLDPFYHDVPKIKHSRKKRSAEAKIKHTDIIRNEQEAVDVLKFLLDWYKLNEKTVSESTTAPTIPTSTKGVIENNVEIIPITERTAPQSESANIEERSLDEVDYNFRNSDLFNRNSKYSIIGIITDDAEQVKGSSDKGVLSVNVLPKPKEPSKEPAERSFLNDYVNDNFEPVVYDQKYGKQQDSSDTSFIDDYVNDNFEPIAYAEKYDKGQKRSDSSLVTPLNEQNKNISSSVHYADDTIKPIYYKERIEKNEESATAGVNNGKNTNNDSSQSGNTQTNVISERVTEQVAYDSKELMDIVIAPRNETMTLNTNKTYSQSITNTTEKSTTSTGSSRSVNDRKRGRRKFFDNNNKNKESEHKNVLIDKLTEKAHTAKDDFNYLRTLYKVYSTTPMYNISDEASPYVKLSKTTRGYAERKDLYSSYVDIPAETSAESKEEGSFTVPVVTTEQPTTSTSTTRKNTIGSGRNRQNKAPTWRRQSQRSKSITRQSDQVVPEKESGLETSTVSYIRKNSTEDLKIGNIVNINASVPYQQHELLGALQPENVTNSVKDEISSGVVSRKPNISIHSSSEIPEITAAATTTTDSFETQTTFLSELTQRYKKLFEVLLSPGQSSPRFKNKYLSTPDISSKSQENVLNANINGITRSSKENQGNNINLNNLLSLGTTTPWKGQLGLEGLFSSTDNSVRNKTRGEDAVTQTLLERKKNISPSSPSDSPFTTQADSTFTTIKNSPETQSDTTLPITTSSTPLSTEHPSNKSEDVTTSLLTRLNQTFTTNENKSRLGSIGTIPTTLSELYKEVKIQPLKDKEFLVQTVKNKSSEDVTSSTEYYVPTGFRIEEIFTTRNYGSTDTTENVPTTQVITEKDKSEDDEEVFNTDSSESTEVVPEQHVLEENRHYHNSFTQRFIITEDSKDIEGISKTGTETDKTKSQPTERSKIDDQTTENMPTTQLTTERTVESTETEENNPITTTYDSTSTTNYNRPEAKKTQQLIIFEIITTPKLTTDTTAETSPTGVFDGSTTQNYEQSATENYQAKETVPITQPTTELGQIKDEMETTTLNTETTQVSKTRAIERLEKFIKEVEATTKGVVVTTETPLGSKIPEGRTENVSTQDEELEKLTEKLAITTEIVEALQELVEEIQQMTNSKMDAASVSEILPGQKMETNENTSNNQIPSTLELTTLVPDIQTETKPITTQSSTGSEDETNRSTTTEKITTVEEPAVTTTVVTMEQPTITEETDRTDTTTITTSEEPTTASRRTAKQRNSSRRDPRPSKRRLYSNFQRGTTRHRFSTETFTKRPEGRKQTIEEEILDEIVKNSRETTTEPIRSSRRRNRKRKRIGTSRDRSTDAPLKKSVIPTQAEKIKESLPTTPLSKTSASRKRFIFNCFGKEVNKFYPDTRDCRLFHYCTQGYSENQLLDMKFVCDFNTYFDDEKLICTKQKPRRCL